MSPTDVASTKSAWPNITIYTFIYKIQVEKWMDLLLWQQSDKLQGGFEKKRKYPGLGRMSNNQVKVTMLSTYEDIGNGEI